MAALNLFSACMLGSIAVANCDCGWTHNCGPRGCADCKDDGSQGFRDCCPAPAPSGDCSWVHTCGSRGCADCKDDGSEGYKQCCSPGPSPTPPPPPGPNPCGSQTPVECHGALKKSGNRIVDKNGASVKLNGMSEFWSNWAGAFWNADMVKYLVSEWKVNIIRCAMGVSNDGGPVAGGYADDPEGNKAKVSVVVDAATAAGIYVVIDWHVEGRCNAGQSKPFFDEMANKYGKQPNVIFETCNEPHDWPWGAGLKSYHEQVIPTIRAHSSNLIIAGTNTWSQDVDDASRDPLSDSNVAYTLHFYSSVHKQSIRDKASTALANGAAIFVTEWGVEQHGEGNAETNTWLNFLDQNSISNCMWGIYDKDSEAWAIVKGGKSSHGGWADYDLTDTGRFVKAYFLREAGSMREAGSTSNETIVV